MPDIDARKDRQWFRDHPKEKSRLRLATARERLAHGLPLGTAVRVFLLPDNTQGRAFLQPTGPVDPERLAAWERELSG